MNIFDNIEDSVTSSKILIDPTPDTVNPSTVDPTPVPPPPLLTTDPSPDILTETTSKDNLIDPDVPLDEPVDLRVSQNTGKLIHNWWVYYLKSVKKFLSDTFDDSINNYEFNYANKSVLLKKLYKQLDVKNPSCIINLTYFRTDSNLDTKRRATGFYNPDQTVVLARNITKAQDVRVDFKYVNLTQSITLNFDDATDVLNYYDRFTSVFPLNKDFVNYDYRTLINIHDQTANWEMTDLIDGMIYDAAILGADAYAGPNSWPNFLPPQRWAEYYCCPQFTVTGVTQNIDKHGQKYSLIIDLNTLLRVPQAILTNTQSMQYLKAIQVVLDIGTTQNVEYTGTRRDIDSYNGTDLNALEKSFYSTNDAPTFTSLEKPICIDIDRAIYESYKMENVFYLSPKINFDKVNGKLILPPFLEPVLKDKAGALYLIQDSTINEPILSWSELGFLHRVDTDNLFTMSEEETLINDYHQVSRTISYLKEVGVDLEVTDDQLETVIEVLEIDIPKFENIKDTLDRAGSWFDARLFLFDSTDHYA